MRLRIASLALGIAALGATPVARADASIPFQGRLTDRNGAGITQAVLTVRLFDAASATSPVVTLGPLNNVVFKDGVFSLALGLTEAQLDLLFAAGKRAQLQIVAKLADGTELTLPRQELGGVPLALRVPIGDGLRFDADGKLVVDIDEGLIPAGIARDSEIPSLTAPGAFGEATPSTVKATELRLPDADGTVVTLKANAATPSNYVLTLPVNDGNNGNLLMTDGNGNLSWAAPGGGGDMYAATYDNVTGTTPGVVDDSEKLNGEAAAFYRDASNLNAGEIADARIPVGIARVADLPTDLPPSGPAGGALSGAYPDPTLANDAVVTGKIANGTILDEDIAASGITTAGKVSGSAITSGTIGGATAVATTGAIATSGNVTLNGTAAGSTELRFREDTDEGTDYVALKAPAVLGGPLTFTLPDAAGTPGQLLSVGAGGVLTWTSASGAAIADNAVTNAKVADNAIGNAELADNAVNTAEIADNAITNPKLADNAVNTAELADNAVTNLKLADNAVNTAEIADNAITNPKLADNAVNTAEVADNAITNPKLADNAVNTAEIADNAITNPKLADNAVNTAEIADDAVTNAKLAPNAVTGTELAANAVTGAHVDPATAVTVATATANTAIRVKEAGVGTDYTIFQGGTQSADITYTLPSTIPGAGHLLSTSAVGVLSWVPAPVSGVPGITSSADATAITIDTSENVTFTQNLAVNGTIQAGGSGGDAVFIGNDAKLADVNASNTMAIMGTSDGNIGSLRLGNTGGTLSGYIGRIGVNNGTPSYTLDVSSGAADFAARVQNTNTSNTEQGLLVQTTANAGGQSTKASLEVRHGATTDLFVATSGQVGVNNAAPTANLDVIGAAAVRGAAAGPLISLQGSGNNGLPELKMGSNANPSLFRIYDNGYTHLTTNTAQSVILGANGSAAQLALVNGGDVGVGTAGPAARLDVYQSGPAADEILFNVGTNTDANRFYVDAEGDVYQDGSLLIQDDSSYVRTTKLRSNIEMTLDIDSNNNVTTDYFAITHNGGAAELMRVQENGRVGIGTNNPGAMLEVNGQVKISGGTPAAGEVLTSDGAGLATWEPASGANWAAPGAIGSTTPNTGVFTSIGIGTATPDTTLTVAGSTLTSQSGVNHYRDVLHFDHGLGGTGTLKIVMPKTWSMTMLTIRIVGYNHLNNPGVWEVLIGATNQDGGSPQWTSATAVVRGRAPFSSVRLGHDGTKNVILLGDVATSWNHEKVMITDVTAAYSNVTGWGSGWSASYITDESGIASIVSPAIDMFTSTAGNVGVGTNSPTEKLHVAGNLLLTGQLKGMEATTAATLVNSWANFGAGYLNAGYYKDKQGIVHLTGMISTGTPGNIAFFLPVGYRPTGSMAFAVPSNNAICTLYVLASGNVTPWSNCSSTWVSLEGVTFRTD